MYNITFSMQHHNICKSAIVTGFFGKQTVSQKMHEVASYSLDLQACRILLMKVEFQKMS